MIELVSPEQWHIKFIASNMRVEDRFEIKLMGRQSPIRGLSLSERHSALKYTVLIDGVPVAMFGVGDKGLNPFQNKGVVWFLGTPAVEGHAREFVLRSKFYLDEMFGVYKALENMVYFKNEKAVRLVRFLLRLYPLSSMERVGDWWHFILRRE